MTWQNEEFLVAIIFLAIFLKYWLSPKKSLALKFPSLKLFQGFPSSGRVFAYKTLPLLKFLGLVLLIIALARPQKGNEHSQVTSQGISIMMVVDTSGSMKALDFSEGDSRKNRLEVVKEVFSQFVQGDKRSMLGRANDLIGIVGFGGYPESKCPLTIDHEALLEVLEELKTPEPIYRRGRVINEEDFQTAIGDAVAIGVERLQKQPGKSKVLVLLTDGENNAGVIDPLVAAEIANSLGVKIYTIGVGSTGEVPYPVKDPRTGKIFLQNAFFEMDEKLLRKIAETTGGKYFLATDRSGLSAIYHEIDRLERYPIEITYLEYQEFYSYFLISGLILLILEQVLSQTILRKVP